MKEGTCPFCGKDTIEFLDTFWESDDKITVTCRCDTCKKLLEQHYDATYTGTTETLSNL